VWLVFTMLAACGRLDFDTHVGGDAQGGSGDATALRDGHGGDGPSAAAIEFLQSTGLADGTVLTITATFSSPLDAGDLVLVGASLDGNPPSQSKFHDTQMNSFTTCSNGVAAPAVVYLAYTYAMAGADSISFDINAAPNSYLEIAIWNFRGVSGAPDSCAQAQGQSLATDGAISPALSATTSNELLFAWGVFDGVGVAGTGFTSVSEIDGDAGEEMLLTAPGSYHATETMDAGGTNWTIAGATFRGD
jgi:hypothetical protein